MCQWEWKQCLKSIAQEHELSFLEKQVFLLIQQDFSQRKQLQELAEQNLNIGEETFRSRMTEIYRKLQIQNNENPCRPDRFTRLMKKLRETFSQISIVSPISAEDAGITQIHPNFPRERFKQRLYKVITEEDIDYKKVDILQTFAPNLNDFRSELINCINHGVSVRIVLSWPHSRIAKLREDVLNRYALTPNNESINFQHEVISNLQTLESILRSPELENPQDFLQVKLYDTMPSIALYRAGNYVLSSCFFHGKLAINNFQLEMNCHANHSLVIESYQKDFDLMLELSKDFTDSLANNNWRNDLEDLFYN